MRTARPLLIVAAAGLAMSSHVFVPPSWATLREFGSWLVRPILLPLAWSAMNEASRAGDATETFARGQQILQLLPTWTDGHAVFAYRYALDTGTGRSSTADRATTALRRLQTALAWLEHARRSAGRHEVDLLQSMAFLPEVAVAQEPGLVELLREQGGPIALADAYLAIAERLRPSAPVREQRTFLAPRLAAGLLATGNRTRALVVLDTAIERSADVTDRALATEWRTRLDEVRRWLRGEPGIDLTAVTADPRMAPLLPHLR